MMSCCCCEDWNSNDANGNGTVQAGEMTGFTLLDHIDIDWGGDPDTDLDHAGFKCNKDLHW